MNKTVIGVIVAVFVVAGVWYFASGRKEATGPLETTQVKIADLPVLHGLPLYLAIEKGYFKEEGIDVELVKMDAPNLIIDAIMSGQVDFTSPSAAAGITGIADSKNPGKIKVYIVAGGDDEVSSSSFLVKNDSTIASIPDLKGKKLGVLPGIQWRTIARHILAQNNLTVDTDVTLAELAPGLQAPALASGQVDALLAIEPMPTIVKSKNIGKEIVRGAAEQGVATPFYGGAGAVRVEFAQQNPNTTAKVIEVLRRAVKEIQRDRETAKQYLKGYTPLEDSIISEAPVLRFRMSDELTRNDISAMQKFYDIFSTYKVVDGPMSFENLIYSGK